MDRTIDMTIDRKLRKTRNLFMIAVVFCMVFAAIYEYFSHDVYSNYMIFAFCIPLFMGVLPYSLMGFVYHAYLPNTAVRSLYNSGVLTLMTGSIFSGILEIYGTTNKLLLVYPTAAVAMIIAAGVVYGASFIASQL